MTAAPPRRLVCLPGAGMDADVFRSWAPLLPTGMELITPELPGKRRSLDEPPLASVEELAAEVLAQLPTRPAATAFFGFSLGALVAYEAAVQLPADQPAVHLFLAGSRAPDRPTAELGFMNLPDDELRAAVSRLTPEARRVFADDDLTQLLLPVMRADFTAAEEYEAAPQPGCQVPITVLHGEQDAVAPASEVLGWSRFTHGPFRFSALPGEHTFVFDQPERVVALVNTYWRTVNTDTRHTVVTRETVRQAWQQVLGHESFGDEDDFFAVGGNSLLAAKVTAEVSKRAGGVRVPLRAFFAAPTVAGVAATVSERIAAAEAVQ
ncbi:alpha/beta fold hydrolase [Streptomyces sp. NPDC018045]|uniref:alpha/beta fold hydrolase n=1 Tax=Streptomyces sp. NPDC018045 TaxID=3365037 RepID=UPI0037AD1F91